VPSRNLDFVRSIRDAWERGDYSSAEWAHPEIEFAFADGPAPGSWKGLAGMAEGTRSWVSAWEKWSIDAEEYSELDDERVLVLTRYRGRGKTSGVDIAQTGAKGAELFHVRGGEVTKLVIYWDCGNALADLGLAPEAGPSRS
jgi:ketosteroid isomerase-like protein